MQVRNTIWTLTALCAMSLVMTGCPEEGGSSVTCASSTDCLESEVCHPAAKVCVATCASSADCPDAAKTCAAVSTTDTTKVCQCSTDALCNADRETADLVCSTLDKVCTTKCTANSCGTGRTCDTATGQCKAGGGNTGDSCVGEAQSTCSYGQYCAASKCTAVAAPTCANFNPSQGGKSPVWTTSSTGPIIYEVTQVSFANDSFCSGAVTAKARVKAYTTSTFPASKDNLDGLFYVRVNGSELSGKGLIRPSEYSVSADGKMASMVMNFCPDAAATTLSIGLYFTGGNETCFQLNK